jgi:hypothetical protein
MMCRCVDYDGYRYVGTADAWCAEARAVVVEVGDFAVGAQRAAHRTGQGYGPPLPLTKPRHRPDAPTLRASVDA